jgi:hypothetical protein
VECNSEDFGLKDEQILETAKRRWKLVNDAESKQRQREREDIAYQIPENQWPADARKERIEQSRPMLSVSLLHQPMQIVQNQAANANLGINVSPVGEKTDKNLAKVMQELVRRIQRDSNANVARLWALDRAKQCGRGWYRIVTRYDEDAESTLDQEIGIERIFDQSMVYADPSSQNPDYSDGKWLYFGGWVRLDTFRELYPEESEEHFRDGDWEGISEHEPEWVRGTGPERAVLLLEEFEKEHETIHKNGHRMLVCRKVNWRTLTANKALDKTVWPSKYIPFIPVVGRELQPIDGERRWEGMVRPARDAQQFFNYSITSATERMALEPRAPFLVTPEQIAGYVKYWESANTRNWPYLPYNNVMADGKPLPPPQRMQIDQSGTSLSMMGVELGRNLVQSATAIFDPGLGAETDKEKSGRAILALQQQGDQGNSHYLNSMATVSMPLEGKQLLDLIPHVYDRPGRVTTVLGGEDEVRSIMVGVPFTTDPESGQPMEADPRAPGVQTFDFAKGGRYSVAVSIGKSKQTRLQEGREALAEMLPNLPPEAQVILLPTFLRFQEAPGSEEAADMMKRFRDMKFPGISGDDQPLSGEDAKAKVAAMEQQLQTMQQEMRAMAMALETDKAKQEATLVKTQMDNQTKLTIAKLDQLTELMVASMKASSDTRQGAMDRIHDKQQRDLDRATDVAKVAAGGQTQTWTKEGNQEQEGEREREQGQTHSTGREASSESGRDQPAEGE